MQALANSKLRTEIEQAVLDVRQRSELRGEAAFGQAVQAQVAGVTAEYHQQVQAMMASQVLLAEQHRAQLEAMQSKIDQLASARSSRSNTPFPGRQNRLPRTRSIRRLRRPRCTG